MAKRGDIDAIRNALRPRMGTLAIAGTGGGSTTVPPHTHAASVITVEPAGNIAADDVQEALEELDSEKLARDGSQTMLGALPMNDHSITGITNATFTGAVGDAEINAVRQLHLTGAEADGEARIDGVKALAFTAVTPTAEVGRLAWDSVEKTLVYFVNSGA